VEEEGADTEAEVVSVVEVDSTTTCMAVSMDTCHSLQKILPLSQALLKDLQLTLPRVPRLCVRACPIVASTAGADTKEAGTLIPRLPLNLNLFRHNHHNRKKNAACHLLKTTVSVVDHLHIQGQVRTAESGSTVSSLRIAKHELADVKDAVATKENMMTSLPTRTERRMLPDQTLATKTHLRDHVVVEEIEKSTVRLAKIAETATIAVAVADLVTTRTIVAPTTINLHAPRAVVIATAREKRNARIAIEATVIANVLAEIVRLLPTELLTITPLPAVHAAKNQLQPTTTKASRSRVRAQATNPSLHPPALATLATTKTPTDDPVLPLWLYPKTPPPHLPTPTLKNAKHASKNAWLKNNKDVKAPPRAKETEVVKQEEEVLMLGMRGKEEERVGRLVIGMRMRKGRRLELRELRGRGRLGDGGSREERRERRECKIEKWNAGLWMQELWICL
jgi:hypothetical protein